MFTIDKLLSQCIIREVENDYFQVSEEENRMIKNLTPHDIKVFFNSQDDFDGQEISFSKTGVIARVSTSKELVGTVGDIPTYKTTFGNIEGLPEEQEGVYYIVSAMILNHPETANRKDLLSPGELVRDKNGNPVGCLGFSVL